MLKQRGKKLFVLTNSPFPFVDGGMCYLFQVLFNTMKELFWMMWLLTSVRLHITLTCADCCLDSIMPFADGISQDRYVEVSQTVMLASYTHGKALLCYIGDRFLIQMQTRSSCIYNNIRKLWWYTGLQRRELERSFWCCGCPCSKTQFLHLSTTIPVRYYP